MAYRADIEIAVKGGRELAAVSKQVADLGRNVAAVNKAAKLQGAIPASINNYNAALGQANATIRASAAGTKVQKQAIDLYVTSLAQAEKAERNLAVAIKQRQRELNIKPKVTGAGGTAGGRLGGVASNAIIGGAFPLLFGQGGGAATGGAIGGAVGGLFGGTFGFAGSLLGTLLGQIASQAGQVKELATDIGLSATQTELLAQAFKQAGSEFEKFQDSVQNIRGLNLSVEEQANAIRLVSQLTETYGGKINKVTDAFTGAMESGKVTQATLNQLTSQGIPIQEALAQKYGVSRSAILAMAKDGQISVQTLSDVLVDMGNKGLQAGEKPRSAFEQFSSALGDTATAVGNVASVLSSVLAPAIDSIILKATQALNILTETINTELLRTDIQAKSGKILSPKTLKNIEKEAMEMAARRFPSKAEGNQLAAGPGLISSAAQAEFQILREQGIRNELQRFGYETGILKAPKPVVAGEIGRITAPGQLPPSGGDGGGSKGKAKKERESQLADILAANGLFRAQETIAGRIAVAEVDQNKAEVARLQHIERSVQLLHEAAAIERSSVPLDEKQAQLRGVQDKLIASTSRYEREIATEKIAQVKAADEIIADLKLELALKTATTEEERKRLQLEADRAKLEAQLKGLPQTQIDQITALQAQVSAPLTDAQNIEQRIGKLKDEVAELTNIGNIAITVADGIGTAFSQAFTGLISGSMSAQEALGSFFKSVADMFLEMAAQIIAKQITMIILQTILKALGAGGGGGGGGGAAALGSNPNVGAYSGTGIGDIGIGSFPMRANGGPVTSQQPYIVGERGLELFVPGTGGSVVNNNDLRSAMGAAPGSGSGSPVLNMSFQSTNINGVEYVSRDQLEAAMAQTRRDASRDGAQRGMSMTLDKLQQSPSTRSRVGIR